ncbi:hypothetical protein CCOS865_01803 [Pseudomonas reidholzensis]|uniref:Uncharacterized protein n=1 Tax=Pseudomonas reidholzensis TaxID=1785162 RepID=A0A383RR64_9PSED|nr:hypothetical protein [Pseudomonas reidholzensis]SYX89549.1 hypothetical protein CCOS865_01803 [Pseudomonas reidholzensis]
MTIDLSKVKGLAAAAVANQYDAVALNEYGAAVPPATVLGLIAEIERHRLMNAEGCKPDSNIQLSGLPCAGAACCRSLEKVEGCKPDLITRYHLRYVAERSEKDVLLEEVLDAVASIGMHDLVDRINDALAVDADRMPLSPAVTDVLTERCRQRYVEGHSTERDDHYVNGELATAAAAYAFWALLSDLHPSMGKLDPPCTWPWEPEHWKPSGHRNMLVKAGALIMAEIERLDRQRASEVRHD